MSRGGPVDADFCVCCDLPMASCGRAVEARQAAERRARREEFLRAGAFPAQYAGVCDGCDDRFGSGALIRPTTRGWRAECCA